MNRSLQWTVTCASALCVILMLRSSERARVDSAAYEPEPPAAIEIERIDPVSPRETEVRTPLGLTRPEEAEARREAPVLRPDSEALERGGALLRAGAFPRLRATYVRIGFAAYRDAVVELGGAFYLYDARARQPLAEVDPRTGGLRDVAVRTTLSRWPRDVTRHLPAALRRGRERFGQRVSRVVLLPPASLDAALLGALDQHLRGLGSSAGALLRVDVAYELRADRLHCEVLSVGLRDGSERSLGLRIDLSAGATS